MTTCNDLAAAETPEQRLDKYLDPHPHWNILEKWIAAPKNELYRRLLTRDQLKEIVLRGLWRASRKFDPSKGMTEFSYAWQCCTWRAKTVLGKRIKAAEQKPTPEPDYRSPQEQDDALHGFRRQPNSRLRLELPPNEGGGGLSGSPLLASLDEQEREFIELLYDNLFGHTQADAARLVGWGASKANASGRLTATLRRIRADLLARLRRRLQAGGPPRGWEQKVLRILRHYYSREELIAAILDGWSGEGHEDQMRAIDTAYDGGRPSEEINS
ncbi:hypothetical protein [Limnoglobus roseus]|uniref:Uncharacterized protein n=1 Tax=Limnoglobus roseus TaxID=2598579 RepID=A0A5C1AFD4_9BACT|nr:hypothetical protein [Limnoglobus roseus]QEL16907.1 hypothetical protein PX52LOC_03882 [Limnoglobus roseus]